MEKCSECGSTDISEEAVDSYIQDGKLIILIKLTCNNCKWTWNKEK